ncbi:hypothetical protein [Paenibacillus glucanolyticus]|jgi:hypothetical protein|nr:hypothetical protein [Paenibacillus glucanolyticus]
MWILPELWDTVKNSCENKKISHFFEEYTSNLLLRNWEIPYQINRQVSSYRLRAKFSDDFPLQRKRISLNTDQMNDLKQQVQNKLLLHYGSEEPPSLAALVTMVLYLFCKEQNIILHNELFFSDEYFSSRYVLSEQSVLEKMNEMFGKLGRLPTAREYAEAGGEGSLSYLKTIFGSFSNAKAEYVLRIQDKSNQFLE